MRNHKNIYCIVVVCMFSQPPSFPGGSSVSLDQGSRCDQGDQGSPPVIKDQVLCNHEKDP